MFLRESYCQRNCTFGLHKPVTVQTHKSFPRLLKLPGQEVVVSTTQPDKRQTSHRFQCGQRGNWTRNNLPEVESGAREDDGQGSSCQRIAGDARWAAHRTHCTPLRDLTLLKPSLQDLRTATDYGCWVNGSLYGRDLVPTPPWCNGRRWEGYSSSFGLCVVGLQGALVGTV